MAHSKTGAGLPSAFGLATDPARFVVKRLCRSEYRRREEDPSEDQVDQ